MAQFDILLTDGRRLSYETDPARLTDESGARIPLDRFALPYADGAAPDCGQIAFSPDNPVLGKTQPKLLKIQLGLGCNYSCGYCSQGGQVENATGTQDAVRFIANLDTWLTEAPEKIEFWGGEPILYWAKLLLLVPALKQRFPEARMSLVTNGSLLTTDKALQLYEWGFSMAVSHDGPGQSLRGEDPSEDAGWRHTIKATRVLFGDRFCFNVVITPKNFDLLDTILWFERRFGEGVRLNVEDVVTDYGGAKWTPEQLKAMYAAIRRYTSTGLSLVLPRLRWSVVHFLQTLAIGKPFDGGHQVCGMDRREHLAVDLNGDVLTCQNAGAESGHRIGKVADLAGVSLTTSRSYTTRPGCRECPVVHLCYGSCMFLSGREFESSCEASYWYNRAILEGIVTLLTGQEVVSISGKVPGRKPFPIPVITG